MAKKHLLPDENEEFLDRLGLTETDKRVYIAALDGGLVSAGEIQQFTKIKDLGKILESIRDLIDVGLIKKAQGMMPRYYATLPFFRETLSVEREFKFALEAMLQSLVQAKENTIKNRELIVAARFPAVVDQLLDDYYKEILAPIISDLEEVKEEVKSQLMPFIRDVDQENQNIKDEIKLMLQPLVDYSKLIHQQFDLGLINEGEDLRQYVSDRTQHRIAILKNAHQAISKNLEGLKNETSSLTQELRSMHLALQEQVNTVGNASSNLSSSLQQFGTELSMIDNAKKEIQAELVVAREQVKRVVHSEDPNKDEQIDTIFQSLTEKIKKVTFSSEKMQEVLQSADTSLKSASSSLTEVVSDLDQAVSAIAVKLNTYFDTLKGEMTGTFNSLNEQDEQGLEQFSSKMESAILQLRDSILKEGDEVTKRLGSHISEINEQQGKTLGLWQEKMVALFDRPVEVIDPFLQNWLDRVGPLIDKFKSRSDEALIDILEPIVELENGTFSTLTERIGFVKAMIEGRSNDLQKVLEFAKNFDFTKTADTWVVVGLPAIYASITDQLLRTKSTVTVITPYLDLELIEVARTMKATTRVTFVTDIDPDKDARLISKLEDIGRIRLRKYSDRDLFACLRDSEELVFGYIREGEETMGIRASTPSIVKLIEDRLNEIVIRNSKAL